MCDYVAHVRRSAHIYHALLHRAVAQSHDRIVRLRQEQWLWRRRWSTDQLRHVNNWAIMQPQMTGYRSSQVWAGSVASYRSGGYTLSVASKKFATWFLVKRARIILYKLIIGGRLSGGNSLSLRWTRIILTARLCLLGKCYLARVEYRLWSFCSHHHHCLVIITGRTRYNGQIPSDDCPNDVLIEGVVRWNIYYRIW